MQRHSTGGRARKLEIGCGVKKPWRQDFIGLDRFALDGVDVICDLDCGHLPFSDNAFDLVYASHSLEHVRDLLHIVGEIWRVCRPGAQLCILAPYYSTLTNLANPYHHQVFNEHTPRFWTSSPKSPVDSREYYRPPSQDIWGLASSDNSRPSFDFRCVRMEFFYFRKFAHKGPRVLRELRKTRLDVCHSILYHLVAFKPPMSEDDVDMASSEFYISPEILALRRETAPRSILAGAKRFVQRVFAKAAR